MRKQITQIGVVASRSANRLYDEKLKPFSDEIKKKEGKEVFIANNKKYRIGKMAVELIENLEPIKKMLLKA